MGLITLVPRTCAVRQEVEAWGQQHSVLPLWLEKPGRTRQEPPRRWHGQSVVRRVPVEYADGRLDVAEIRFLVAHSSQLAHQAAVAYAAAQAKEAERVTAHVRHVEARWFARRRCGGGYCRVRRAWPGAAWRQPRPWRYHVLHYQVEAVNVPQKRTRRGRPPKAEVPPVELLSRLRVHPEALVPSEEAHGGTVLATTVGPEGGTDAQLLQAYQEQHITVEPGFRWIKNPPPSVRYGWRSPHGLRPWPCSRWWGCSCMR